MKTSYSGLFTLQTGGLIDSVQVTSPGGISMPLPIETYTEREVLPLLSDLLSQEEFKVLLNTHQNGEKYPTPETIEINKLVKRGYMARETISVVNEPGVKAIISHKLTEAGLKLVNKYNGI